ncbi:MAG: flagellar basal body rod C-terminal domain-containing protein [Ilumatobacteraceae bacterium]
MLPGPTAPGPLDGEQARLIAALAESATGPDRTYQSLVTTLAVETRAANNRATIQEQIADTAIRDADSVGAVSIDEEMAMMISAQRAFEANAGDDRGGRDARLPDRAHRDGRQMRSEPCA